MDLSTIELFDGIGHDALRQVYSRAVHRQFPAGSVICREGEPGNSMFVIEGGGASVTIAGERVRRLRQGDVIGEIAVLTGEPRSATVTAVLPTDVIELHRDALSAVMAATPQLLSNLTRLLSRRLATAHDRQVATRRGEAVGLALSESLLPQLKSLVTATEGASARPVTFLALESLERSLEQLDRALSESAFVFVPVELKGSILRTLDAHMDRVVAVVRDQREAEQVGGDADVVVLDPDDPARVAWLGRHLTRTKLGLALGAGGAKGFAHVGALSVLQDAGYTVDCVAGSSIGAIVGACLAMGMDAAEVDATLRRRFSEDVVKTVFSLSFSGGSSGYDTMKAMTTELAGGRSFEQLDIPMTVMTVDLSTRQPVPISDGPLDEALLAGTALAGLFPPFVRGSQRLVDGLALVPVPTDSARALGADVVVSVNLMSRETLPAWPGEEAASGDGDGQPVKQRLLETMLEVMDLAQLDASVRHAAKADVAITPRFGPCTWRDFHMADRFLAAGREAAHEMLPALQGVARPQT